MRSGVSRRVNRQPIRSPSPDIANKSIIVNTVAPVSEVLKKSRISSKSNLPNSGSLTQIEDLQKAMVDWQQRYRILEKQLNSLLIENTILKKEVHGLNEFITKKQEEGSSSATGLKVYESRMSDMMQEIQRVQKLLQLEKDKNQVLSEEIQTLARNPIQYARPAKSIYPDEPQNDNYELLSNTLNLSFQRIRTDHQLKVRLLLDGLTQRLGRVEQKQGSIKKLIQRRQFATPNKGTQPQDLSTAHLSQSRREHDKLIRRSRQIPQYQHQRQKVELQSELQRLATQNLTLKQQLQNAYSRPIQQQTQQYTTKKQTVLTCLTCKIYEKRINQLRLQLSQYASLDKGNRYEKETSQKELKQRQQSFSYNLQDYLKRIRNVKSILNNEEFLEFTLKVTCLIQHCNALQGEIQELKTIERQLKNREIDYQVRQQALQRDNEILKSQVNEQQLQLQQMRELLDQINHRQEKNRQTYRNKTAGEALKELDTRNFQQKLQQAIKKLQSLQHSMQTTIQE